MAEYVTANADRSIVRKPVNITFKQAAAIPVAAVTALQKLRDKGRLQPGQKVLINGASLVADNVIDYTKENFTEMSERYAFDQGAAATAYLEEGHARAKVVVTLP